MPQKLRARRKGRACRGGRGRSCARGGRGRRACGRRRGGRAGRWGMVVVVTHPPLGGDLQHERQAFASRLHPKRARMNVWRATALHGRPNRGVQFPTSDVRSSSACMRQSSFCEAQDFSHSRHVLSHGFLAHAICEVSPRRRTKMSSVGRGQTCDMARQSRGSRLHPSMMVLSPPVRGLAYHGRRAKCQESRTRLFAARAGPLALTAGHTRTRTVWF